jgi:hypothetical protein
MSQEGNTDTLEPIGDGGPEPVRPDAAGADSADGISTAISASEALIAGQPIRQLQRDGVEYTVIGTAHVSRASANAVRELAASGGFDAIAVELCQARYDALTAERKWTDLDLYRVLREGKAGLVMANLALSAYQRRIAEQFGIEPGAEMRAAAVAAKAHGLPLQLVDRDLATTLRRSYASVPWYKRFYLMAGLALGMVSSDEIDEEAIEKLKEGDILESTFTEFAEQSPELYEALISERDRYMAARLRQDNAGGEGHKVLVVIGAGHMEGLAGQLESGLADPADPDRLLHRFFPQPRARLAVDLHLGGDQRRPGRAGRSDRPRPPADRTERRVCGPDHVAQPDHRRRHGDRPGRILDPQTTRLGPGKPALRHNHTEGLVPQPGDPHPAGVLPLQSRLGSRHLGGRLQDFRRAVLTRGPARCPACQTAHKTARAPDTACR